MLSSTLTKTEKISFALFFMLKNNLASPRIYSINPWISESLYNKVKLKIKSSITYLRLCRKLKIKNKNMPNKSWKKISKVEVTVFKSPTQPKNKNKDLRYMVTNPINFIHPAEAIIFKNEGNKLLLVYIN